MSSLGEAEHNRCNDKDSDPCCATANHGNGSFFDASFDFERDALLESSDDVSMGSRLFDEMDPPASSTPSHTQTDAMISSPTTCAPSITRRALFHDQDQLQGISRTGSFARSPCILSAPGPNVPVTPTRKLVHRFRPDGISISQEHLLSLEGHGSAQSQQKWQRQQEHHHHTLGCNTQKASSAHKPHAAVGRPTTPPSTTNLSWSRQTATTTTTTTPKTPRTPKEREYRVGKTPTGPRISTDQSMQPSNYYVEHRLPALHNWGSPYHRFMLEASDTLHMANSVDGGTMPVSPPRLSKAEQFVQPHGLVKVGRQQEQQQQQQQQPLDSPTRPLAANDSIMSPFSPPALQNLVAGCYIVDVNEQEAIVSPLTPWADGVIDSYAFSPVSPLLDEAPYFESAGTTRTAQMQPPLSFTSECDEPETSDTRYQKFDEEQRQQRQQRQQTFECGPPSGLMIDFGGGQPPAFQSKISVDPDGEEGLTGMRSGLTDHRQTPDVCLEHSLDHDDICICGVPASCGLSTSPAMREVAGMCAGKPRRRSGNSRKTSSSDAEMTGKPRAGGGRLSSSRSRRQLSAPASGVPQPAGSDGRKAGGKTVAEEGGPAGETFVNFTPSDSRKILTGVAPSGSSKTKARREKEATERRRKLSEAAQRAVREAGGDWERVVGELVEV